MTMTREQIIFDMGMEDAAKGVQIGNPCPHGFTLQDRTVWEAGMIAHGKGEERSPRGVALHRLRQMTRTRHEFAVGTETKAGRL
jgi:hypothetical protein